MKNSKSYTCTHCSKKIEKPLLPYCTYHLCNECIYFLLSTIT